MVMVVVVVVVVLWLESGMNKTHLMMMMMSCNRMMDRMVVMVVDTDGRCEWIDSAGRMTQSRDSI